MAHLDITHFKSLTKEEEQAIENQANRIINNCTPINKSMMDKAEAERQHGFRLYQGGVVPETSSELSISKVLTLKPVVELTVTAPLRLAGSSLSKLRELVMELSVSITLHMKRLSLR